MTGDTLRELEKQVIGAIFLNPDTIVSITDIISPNDMTQANGTILSYMANLYTDGKPIDIGTVSAALDRDGELNRAGGLSYLVECTDIPTSANAGFHSREIKKQSIRNRVKSWGASIVAREWDDEIDDMLGGLERGLLEIADSTRPKKSPRIDDILTAIATRQASIENDESDLWIPSTFWGEAIPGYYKGHFWTITGYTSYGKSSLLSTMLIDIMENGGKPLVFSLEDSRAEKVMGLRGVMTDVPKAWQLQGTIANNRDNLARADRQLKAWQPIIYDDVRTLDDMRLKTKKHVMRDGVNVVAIDYIQQIQEQGALFDRMSHAASYLQGMFKDLGVTGIILSQIDNATAKEGGVIIGAKGGGDIPAASDIVITMERPQDGKRVNLAVRKNRPFGRTGVRNCTFNDRWTKIEYIGVGG